MTIVGRGSIVWIEMVDPNGVNIKSRPAVVLSTEEQIQIDGHVRVLAVSSQVDPADVNRFVEIPWSNQLGGHRKTKLRKKSFVICDWMTKMELQSVKPTSGFVPKQLMQEIQVKYSSLLESRTRNPESETDAHARANANNDLPATPEPSA